MSAPEFLDTNVILYAYDRSNTQKQQKARQLLMRAIAGEIVASAQVLGEFASALLHKLSTSAQDATLALDALSPLRLVAVDETTVRRAVEAHARYGLHFYDGLIIATAERAGCQLVWSEDLNPGQKYFGVQVRNPFA